MTTAATATEVQTTLAAATGARVITNISAFNPAVPMVDVMVIRKGALVHSKSYDAALGAEAIVTAAAAAL